MESMTMKPTTALLPDTLREALNRATAGGLRPNSLRPEPSRPRGLRVPQALVPATPPSGLPFRVLRVLCGPLLKFEI
jgi:hypothetical protein